MTVVSSSVFTVKGDFYWFQSTSASDTLSLSEVVPALDKTLNRRRLISAYPASTCKYLPNIKCSFDQFLAPLTCVLSGDCEIVSAYSRCGGGGAGGNRLTLFYAVKQIQNLATKSIWTTLQSEINSLNFGNFPGQPTGCD